jgi:hypothetical protein
MGGVGQPGCRAHVGEDKPGEEGLHVAVAPVGEQAHVLRIQRTGHGDDGPQRRPHRFAHRHHPRWCPRTGAVLQRAQQPFARHRFTRLAKKMYSLPAAVCSAASGIFECGGSTSWPTRSVTPRATQRSATPESVGRRPPARTD